MGTLIGCLWTPAIHEPITVAKTMGCADWLGLGHVPHLGDAAFFLSVGTMSQFYLWCAPRALLRDLPIISMRNDMKGVNN